MIDLPLTIKFLEWNSGPEMDIYFTKKRDVRFYFTKKRDVRFGSKADVCVAKPHVRFTPNSDRESGHAAKVMSALPPKADMCGALADVCLGPIADIQRKKYSNGSAGSQKRLVRNGN
jgi:hypothetical protein